MNSTPIQDNRHFHRIAHDAPATIARDGVPGSLEARTLDLSLKGCLLDIGAATLPGLGGGYQVTIHLSTDVRIAMTASLAHAEAGGRAGFKCEHIDIDSVSTLRRLVELNLGNPDALDRDLEALAASFNAQSA
jgi:hypothetical protein